MPKPTLPPHAESATHRQLPCTQLPLTLGELQLLVGVQEEAVQSVSAAAAESTRQGSGMKMGL